MNYGKKMAALLLAGAMLMPAFACANNSSTSTADNTAVTDANGSAVTDANGSAVTNADGSAATTTAQGNQVQDFDTPEENVMTALAEGEIGSVNTGTAAGSGAGPNAIVTTLKKNGKVYAPVTDINKKTVTEPNGEAKTEVYTGTTLATTYKDESYEPDYRSYLALWMDIGKHADFTVNGDLLEYEFKIADNCPDGVYPIQMYFNDIANYNGDTLSDVTMVPGYICVNADAPTAEADGAGLTIAPEIVSGKPGDTVTVKVNFRNNPGLVAYKLIMRYDSKACSITDCQLGEDLPSSAELTAHEVQ